MRRLLEDSGQREGLNEWCILCQTKFPHLVNFYVELKNADMLATGIFRCYMKFETKKYEPFMNPYMLRKCNVRTPQVELTPRNLEVGSAYRLSPQSLVSKEARNKLWGITTHIQAMGSKFP